MLPTKRRSIAIFAVCVLAAIGLWLVPFLIEPVKLVFQLGKTANEREKQLLYDIDHTALASELRKFASEKRWRQTEANAEPEILWPNNKAVPASVRLLKPTSVAIFDDRIVLERGGPMLHFGIVVFRDGIVGEGLKELGPGVWFYADNNKIPDQ